MNDSIKLAHYPLLFSISNATSLVNFIRTLIKYSMAQTHCLVSFECLRFYFGGSFCYCKAIWVVTDVSKRLKLGPEQPRKGLTYGHVALLLTQWLAVMQHAESNHIFNCLNNFRVDYQPLMWLEMGNTLNAVGNVHLESQWLKFDPLARGGVVGCVYTATH